MKTLKISEFKATCIRVLKSVARTREPILITLRGKPLVKIEPMAPQEHARVLGGLRGNIEIVGDIIRSDSSEDWESNDA